MNNGKGAYEVVMTPIGAPEGARSVEEHFEKMDQVGEGTYGQVWKAKDKTTGALVALKRIRMDMNEKEGFPITAVREIKLLSDLQHENVILMKEIVTSKASKSNHNKGSIYMVFEYMDHDLSGLFDTPGFYVTQAQAKNIIHQILYGLAYCHAKNVMHRDMKASNLLMNKRGQLKIADFGLARQMLSLEDKTSQHKAYMRMTQRVITLWYRAPELLLGTPQYDEKVDMWSAGCIFAELFTGRPVLQGKDEADQMKKIVDMCGKPTEANWPGVTKLKWYNHMVRQDREGRSVKQSFQGKMMGCGHALDLLEKMLTLDPKRRISAEDALKHSYFKAHPFKCQNRDLPQPADGSAAHEFVAKKRRQADKAAGIDRDYYKGMAAEPQKKRPRDGPQGYRW